MALTALLARTLPTAVIAVAIAQAAMAQTPLPEIGLVIMHGKRDSPAGLVSNLASSLEEMGYLVANLEMPWSRNREYDVGVAAAENEVDVALRKLRDKGARKVFVIGHSQGGLFALHFGSKHSVDGIVAIAPGGNVAGRIYLKRLGSSVEAARRLIAEGKGGEKTEFSDYEGSKGVYAIVVSPAAYLSWFDPDGAMNQLRAVRAMNPQVPVLYIVPTNDRPKLLKVKRMMFDALPENPRSRLYEPDADHRGAPSASRDEIARWTVEVADRPNPALQGTPASVRP